MSTILVKPGVADRQNLKPLDPKGSRARRKAEMLPLGIRVLAALALFGSMALSGFCELTRHW